jgi:hypothetical protein
MANATDTNKNANMFTNFPSGELKMLAIDIIKRPIPNATKTIDLIRQRKKPITE